MDNLYIFCGLLFGVFLIEYAKHTGWSENLSSLGTSARIKVRQYEQSVYCTRLMGYNT